MRESPCSPAVRRSYLVALVFLAVTAVLGFILRHAAVRPLEGVHYNQWLHAHSHVAFLGWVFNAFFAAALRHFVPGGRVAGFAWLWWLMQVAVVGMLVAFPLQGYAPASIAFSSIHLLAAAVFAVRLWARNRAGNPAGFHLKWALFFMLLSGVGPLALGPVIAFGLRETPVYNLAIYFYLHFQYNGWFLFFLQALVLQRAHEAGVSPNALEARKAGWLLAAGCFLTYAQSTFWLSPPVVVHAVGFFGALLQLIGLYLLAVSLAGWSGMALRSTRWLWRLAACALALKFVLQFVGTHHAFEEALLNRSLVVAFLHLVFLGVVTPALLAWGREECLLRGGLRHGCALMLFLLGAVLTEMLLVLPSALSLVGLRPELPYSVWLLGASFLLAAGCVCLIPGRAVPPTRSRD